MDIQESNRLIAEFMGHWAPMYYHSNWNKLMLVVDKIEQTLLPGYEYTYDDEPASFRVAIFVRCCDICVANSTGDNLIEITAAPSKIDAVYKAVVQFIQWYNQQPAKTL